MNLKKIQAVNNLTDLENLGIGRVCAEVGSRGGGVGFYGSDVAKAVGVSESDLSKKYGCGCNYLGGGIRGAIFTSRYNKSITGRKAELLDAIANACIRVYESIENEEGLNRDEYEDGDTNWDVKATKAVRASGTISAY